MVKPTVAPTASAKETKENERKWSKPLMDAGWTVMPNVIIERQQALGLDPLDLNIVLHLASRWWKAEGKPHPSKRTMARAMGVDPRTIQRRIAAMEKDGLIRRQQRRINGMANNTNIYHLDGLIKEATPFAKEALEKRAADESERLRKAARKGRPKLKVVQKGDTN